MQTIVDEVTNTPTTGGRDRDLIHVALVGSDTSLCGLKLELISDLRRTEFEREPCVVCYEIDRAQRIRAGLL